jgi:hypothetical protein
MEVEGQATRDAVKEDGEATRQLVEEDGEATRQLVEEDGEKTRAKMEEQFQLLKEQLLGTPAATRTLAILATRYLSI